MTMLQRSLGVILALFSLGALAAAPAVDAPLPPLEIDDRGELVMQGDDFDFRPWSSGNNPGVVHVIQYFGAKMSHKDLFSPVTDSIQETFAPGSVHVTTVLNMDAALWGTGGFVMSELKKNKKAHPTATMVIDEEGAGVETWELGKGGTGLIVLDSQGVVKFFSPDPLNDEELASTIELIRSNIDA